MSDNTVFMKNYRPGDGKLNEPNRAEILRYAGYSGITSDDETVKSLMEEVISEASIAVKGRVCYAVFDISWQNDIPSLPFECESKDLAKCLKGSSRVVMFAATIGLDIDRLIKKYERFTPSKALLLQAFGAERVEAVCDAFCWEYSSETGGGAVSLSPRFSPGYGDLPLSTQKDFFEILGINKNLAVTLNESLLMTPTKSVTAIFGIKNY